MFEKIPGRVISHVSISYADKPATEYNSESLVGRSLALILMVTTAI